MLNVFDYVIKYEYKPCKSNIKKQYKILKNNIYAISR